MTRRYWEKVGGTLVEEFLAVNAGPDRARRLLDAVIVPDGDHRIASPGEKIDVKGKDVIVVQTKAKRLGMYLMGQALFSRELVCDLGAKSVRSVALCARTSTSPIVPISSTTTSIP